MRRRAQGAPLRHAMSERGFSLPRLARRTQEVDPDGNGVSFQLIGILASAGASSRETTRDRSAHLIAEALDVDVHELFVEGDSSMPAPPTECGCACHAA